MNNMRRGFTMIELIFVIVIIGILAAVAIPKLAATRDDAKITKTVANLKTVLNDAASFYTSGGKDRWENADWSAVTDSLGSQTGNVEQTIVYIKGDDVNCFQVDPTQSDENTTRLDISYIGSGPVCIGAQGLAAASGLIDPTTFDANLTLGGTNVVY